MVKQKERKEEVNMIKRIEQNLWYVYITYEDNELHIIRKTKDNKELVKLWIDIANLRDDLCR